MKIQFPKLPKHILAFILLALIIAFFLFELLLRPKVFSQSLADSLYRAKRYPKAESIFKRNAIDKDPTAAANLAKSLYKQEKYDEAETANEQAVQNAKTKSRAHYDSGNIAYKKQDYQSAIDHYRQSVLLNPKDADAKANFELALRKLQQNPPPPPKQEPKKDKEKQEEIRNILGGLDNKESSDRQQQQPSQAGKAGKWW